MSAGNSSFIKRTNLRHRWQRDKAKGRKDPENSFHRLLHHFDYGALQLKFAASFVLPVPLYFATWG
jgi:hypothetical protein